MKLCFWNNNQICASTETRDIGLPGHIWVDAPADYSLDKVYKYIDSKIEEIPISEYDPTRLRVHRVLPLGLDPLISDFTILGFRKISPSYDRGKKIKAEYKCVDKDELIVEKIFQDVRDEKGILTGLQITFNWYSEDNVVRASKTEIVKEFNKFEAETEERKRRYRQFDYLRASVKGTPNEPYIGMLIHHYQLQIDAYKNDGLPDFNDAMLAETDPTISAILSAPIERNDGQGLTTVMKSIQYQMGYITLAEI